MPRPPKVLSGCNVDCSKKSASLSSVQIPVDRRDRQNDDEDRERIRPARIHPIILLGCMNNEQCIKWEPVGGIDYPCADISFAYDGPDAVSVTMHFSRVKNCLPKDLHLKFRGAISIQWESESFGLIRLPESLPRCGGSWSRWSFPLLRIEQSAWLATYEGRNPVSSRGRLHFALVAMNDLLHILALPTVDARWMEVPITA